MKNKWFGVGLSKIAILALVLSAMVLGSCTSQAPPTTVPTATAVVVPTNRPAATPGATVVSVAATPTAVVTLAPISLTFASIWPETQVYHTDLIVPFVQKVKELSKGQIDIKLYTSAQLGKPAVQSETIGKGVADMGVVVPSYEGGKFPLEDARGILPGVWNDYKYFPSGSRALHDTFPELRKEMESRNLKYLFSQTMNNYQIFAKRPIKSLTDLKGLRIRTAGTLHAKAAESLGLIPASISAAEVYLALDKGTVDGTWTSFPSFYGERLFEVAKYGLEANLFFSGAGYFMNLNTWNKLSKQAQDILIEAAKYAEIYMVKNNYNNDDAYKKKLRDQGMTIATMSTEERLEARKKLSTVVEEWVVANGDVGKRLVDFIREWQTHEPSY